jgi:hypothetical protein
MNCKNCSCAGGLAAANHKNTKKKNDPNANKTATTTLAQMSTGTAILVTHDACSCPQSHSTQVKRQMRNTNTRVSKRQSRFKSRLRTSESEHAPMRVTAGQFTITSCLSQHARHAGKPAHTGSSVIGVNSKKDRTRTKLVQSTSSQE